MRLIALAGLVALAAGAARPAAAATLLHSYDFNGGAITDRVGGVDGALYNGAGLVDGTLSLSSLQAYA
ncbi:MAG TPA: hypothetical protein VHF22_14975, partial [Planctomycetota bacterium]|nr:hypothetical protein [Planctomycetota bacterium]